MTAMNSKRTSEPQYVLVRDGETVLEAVARWDRTHGEHFRRHRILERVAA
jgi:hypothetical protein